MGRTGARGRGALWRWGPNHSIRVIVTRWRKNTQSLKYMHVEGRRMMEFLACKDPVYAEWKLPGVNFNNIYIPVYKYTKIFRI